MNKRTWLLLSGVVVVVLVGVGLLIRCGETTSHRPDFGDVPTWLTFLAAAVGIFFALVQLKVFQKAEEARERKQAEQVSAYIEQRQAATFVVVKNDSSQIVPSCAALYTSYGGEGQPVDRDGPTVLNQHNLGAIPAHGDKQEEIELYPKPLMRGGLRYAAVIQFSDAQKRSWLRDGNGGLHRIGADGEMPTGVLSELDEWQEFWKARDEEKRRASRWRVRVWRRLVTVSARRRSGHRGDNPDGHQGSGGGGRKSAS